jgi:hypothetical protein
MPDLHVIVGGRDGESATACEHPASGDARLRTRVRRCERRAHAIGELTAPAIAMVSKPAADIAKMVAASGWSEAIATRAAFQRAMRTARELGDLFDAAEAKLGDIVNEMVSAALNAERSPRSRTAEPALIAC